MSLKSASKRLIERYKLTLYVYRSMHATRCCVFLYEHDRSVYKTEVHDPIRCSACDENSHPCAKPMHMVRCDAMRYMHATWCCVFCTKTLVSVQHRCIWPDAMRFDADLVRFVRKISSVYKTNAYGSMRCMRSECSDAVFFYKQDHNSPVHVTLAWIWVFEYSRMPDLSFNRGGEIFAPQTKILKRWTKDETRIFDWLFNGS